MRNKKLILSLILILSLVLQCQSQFCEIINEDELQGSVFYTTAGENIDQFNLQEWIVGYNLTYQISQNDNYDPIEQSLNKRATIQYNITDKQTESVVDTTWFQKTNGDLVYSRLTNVYDMNSKVIKQYLVFGFGDDADSPFFDASNPNSVFNIPNSAETDPHQIICLDAIELTEEVVALDCEQYQSSSTSGDIYKNLFFIVDLSDIKNVKQYSFSDPRAFSGDLRRKCDYYENQGIKMILQSQFSIDMGANDNTENALNVYVYDEKIKKLSESQPVSFSDFQKIKISQELFQPTDFEFFNDRIFMSIKNYGLVSFTYLNEVIESSVKGWTFQDLEIFQWTECWGVDIAPDGAYTQVILAGKNTVLVIKFVQISDELYWSQEFVLPFILYGRPTIEANSQYTLIQIGELLVVFDNSQSDTDYTVGVIREVESFQLLQSNVVNVFEDDQLIVYIIQQPTMILYTTQAEYEEGKYTDWTIIAKSVHFDRESSCVLQLKRGYVLPTELGPKPKLFSGRFAYEFEDKLIQGIQMNDQFVGPNLQFDFDSIDGEKTIQFDIPKLVSIQFNPAFDPKDEIFGQIFQSVFTKYEFHIHQIKNFTTIVYECVSKPEKIDDVNCRKIALFDLSGAILHFSYGLLDDNLYLGILTADQPQTIQFRDLNGFKTKNDFKDDKIGNIQQFIIQNQLLYVLSDATKYTIGLYTMLNEQIKNMVYIDSTYVADWKIDWKPTVINVHFTLKNQLFVELPKYTIIISLENDQQPVLTQSKIAESFSGKTYKGFLTPKSFVTVVSDQRIVEHSLVDLTQIEELNEYLLYTYTLYQDVSQGYAISNYSQLFYALGFNTDGKVCIIIYNTQSPVFEQLYTVITTNILKADLENAETILFSVSGRNQVDFIYLNIDGYQSYFRVPIAPNFIIQGQDIYPEQQYSYENTIQFTVSDMNDKNTIDTEKTIVFINLQNNIYLNQKVLDKSEFITGLDVTTLGTQKFLLNNYDWYNGPVLQMSLFCKDCVGGTSGSNLISIQNQVQEIPQGHADYGDLDNVKYPTSAFFDEVGKRIQILDENNDVIQISSTSMKISQTTNIGISSLFSECYDFIPCYKDTALFDKDALNYGIAICIYRQKWVAATVQYFDLDKPTQATGIFNLDLVGYYNQAVCKDNKLFVLQKYYNTQKSGILVFDIVNDISQKVQPKSATLLAEFNSNLYPDMYSTYTSFDIFTLPSHKKFFKLILSAETKYVTVLGFGSDLKISQNDKGDKKELENFDFFQPIIDGYSFIQPNTKVLTTKVIETYSQGTGTVVINVARIIFILEHSPIYELKFQFYFDDGLALIEGAYPDKVYQNYGDFINKPRISINRNYMVAEFYQDLRGTNDKYTIAVYNIFDDYVDGQQQDRASNVQPEFRKMLGGRQYENCFPDPETAFVLYYDRNELRNRILVPTVNYLDKTLILDIFDSSQIIVKPGVKLGQPLQISLISYYATKQNSEIVGYLNPIQQINKKPGCDIILDQYSTPSRIYPSVGLTEEFLLQDLVEGYNLSYKINHTLETNYKFTSFDSLIQLDISPYNQLKEDVIATDQFVNSNGLSSFGRLTRKRSINGDSYIVYLGLSDSKQILVPSDSYEIDIEQNKNIECFDIVLTKAEQAIIYCVQMTKTIIQTKYSDYFYIINANEGDNKYYSVQGGDFVFPGTLENAKVEEYKSQDGINQYLVTGPCFDNIDILKSSDKSYIRVYKLTYNIQTPIITSQYTIYGSDLGLNKFLLADLQVLDQSIYFLDHLQGVGKFDFNFENPDLKTVKDRLENFKFFQNGDEINFTNGWGMSIDYDGASKQLLILDDTGLIRYSHYQVLGKEKLIKQITYPIDVTLSNDPIIEATNEFFGILTGQLLTIYKRDHHSRSFISLNGVQSFNLEFRNTIFVWYRDRVVSYSLQDPHVEITALKEESLSHTLSIEVISTNNAYNPSQESCFIHFSTQSIDKTSTDIYNGKTNQTEFVARSAQIEKQIPLDDSYFGPNLKYSIGLLGETIYEDFKAEFDFPRILNYKEFALNPAKLIYSRIISLGDQRFLKIHQIADSYQLSFQDCSNYFDEPDNLYCSTPPIYNSILSSAITLSTVGLYNDIPSIIFVQENNPKVIYVLDYFGQKIDSRQLNDEISDLKLNKQLLIAIGKLTNTVYIYDTLLVIQSRSKIDYAFIKQWNVVQKQSDFVPLEIDVHHNQGNILFLRIPSKVLIIDLEDRVPRFVSQLTDIKVEQTKKDYQGYLTGKSYIWIGPNNELSSYSTQDLIVVEKLYDYQTYGYNFGLYNINQMVHSVSNTSGYIYILGQGLDGKSNLMIYKSHTMNIRTLYKVIPLKVVWDKKSLPQIAVDGFKLLDFAYINFNSQSYIIRVPIHQAMIVEPGIYYPFNNYTSKFTNNIEVSNDINQKINTLKESVTLTLVNINDDLLKDQTAIDMSNINLNDGLEMLSPNKTTWELPIDTWEFGPILNYSLSCENCQGSFVSTNQVITLQNKIQDISNSTILNQAVELVDLQGIFQSNSNGLLHTLNNKKYNVMSKQLIYNGIGITIDLDEDDQCYSLIPCYNSDQSKLDYAIAICETYKYWIAVVFNHTGTVLSRTYHQVNLLEVNNFDQAQCIDERLVVLQHDNNDVSSIIVYKIYDTLKADDPTKAIKDRTYDYVNLQFTDKSIFQISAFEIVPTDVSSQRKLFFTMENNNFSFVNLYSNTYDLIPLAPVQHIEDIRKKLDQQDLYSPENVEIISMKILSYYLSDVSPTQQKQKYNYRLLLVLQDLPSFELLVVCPVQADQAKNLQFVHVAAGYVNYGTSQPLKYISVVDNMFSIVYYNYEEQMLSGLFYKMSTLLGSEIETFQMNPIYGGYALKNIIFIDQQFVPVLLYKSSDNLFKKETRIFFPYPQFFNDHPRILQINDKVTITAQNSSFPVQYFIIEPNSIYEQKGDEILGIITPYKTEFVDLESEPYCNILQSNYLNNIYLINSIDTTEQHNLDEIFEGYNLTYEIVDPLDLQTTYKIGYRVKKGGYQNFQNEKVKQVIDVDTLEDSYADLDLVRLGKVIYGENEEYSVVFMNGDEWTNPITQKIIRIDPKSSKVNCHSVDYVIPSDPDDTPDAFVFCQKDEGREPSGNKKQKYQQFFYKVNKYMDQPLKKNFTQLILLDNEVKTLETITYKGSDDITFFFMVYTVSKEFSFDPKADNSQISVLMYNPNDIDTDGSKGKFFTPSKAFIYADSFGLNQMNIVDIQMYQGRIYMLDYSQGLISFIYSQQSGVIDPQVNNLVIHGIKTAWGLQIEQSGSFTNFFICTDQILFNLQQPYLLLKSSLQLKHQYPLEKKLQFKPLVDTSGQFVSIQDGSILTIYEKYESNVLKVFKSIPNVQSYTLFQDNYLYIWLRNGLTTFLLQNAYFNVIAKGESTIKNFPSIKAISVNKYLNKTVECKINFRPQNIKADDQGIYKLSVDNSPVIEKGASLVKNIHLDQHYQGPNLKYNVGVKNDAGAQLDDPQQIQVNYPDDYSKNLIFTKLLQITNDLQIQIHQWSQNGKITTKMTFCASTFQNIKELTCDFAQAISLNIYNKISVIIHGLYNRVPRILLTQENVLDLIYVYEITGKLLNIQNFQNSKIIDMDLLHNTLYLLDGNKNSIQVLSTLTLTDKLFQMHDIDQKYVSSWNLQDNWAPTQIASHYSQEEVIFVRTTNYIIVISTKSAPQYLSQISIKQYQGAAFLKFELTKNYLFAIKSDDDIDVYSKQDEKEFTKLYTLPTYDQFIFANPVKSGFQYAVSNHSGYIYVVAYKQIEKINKIQILIYRPCAQNVRNLYYVFDTGITYDKANQYIILTADGGISVDGTAQIDFVQLQVDSQLLTYRVPLDTSLIINTEAFYPKQGTTVQYSIDFKVISLNDTVQDDSVDIAFVNPQNKVYPDETIINNSQIVQQGIALDDLVIPGTVQFNTDGWFGGPVLSMEIKCFDCNFEKETTKSISLINKVDYVNDENINQKMTDLDGVISSFIDIEDDYGYLLNRKDDEYDLIIKDRSLNTVVKFEIIDDEREEVEDLQCIALVPCYSQISEQAGLIELEYAVTICKHTEKNIYIAIPLKVIDPLHPEHVNKTYLELNFINSQLQLDEIQCFDGDLLLLANSNDSPSTIYIYQLFDWINKDDEIQPIILTATDLKLTQTQLKITSFNLFYSILNRKVYKLFLTQEYEYIAVVGLNKNSYQVHKIDTLDDVHNPNLKDKLAQDLVFITNQQKFLNIKVIDESFEEKDGQKYIVYSTIIMIEGAPIVECNIKYRINDQQQFVYDMVLNMEFVQIFTNYGDSVLLKHFTVYDNYMAVSYYDAEKQVVSIVVYDDTILAKTKDQSGEKSSPRTVQIFGGVQYTFLGSGKILPQTSFQLFEVEDDSNQSEQVSILLPSPNLGEKTDLYSIYDNYAIEVTKPDVESQTFSLVPQSLYISGNEIKIQSTITQKKNPNPPGPDPPGPNPPGPKPKDDSYDYGWVIAVSVIGGILVIGAIGYFIWKKRKESQEEGGDVVSQGGYSLQEQSNQSDN